MGHKTVIDLEAKISITLLFDGIIVAIAQLQRWIKRTAKKLESQAIAERSNIVCQTFEINVFGHDAKQCSSKMFAFINKFCLSGNVLWRGQTFKHCFIIKFQMFDKQCLIVWPHVWYKSSEHSWVQWNRTAYSLIIDGFEPHDYVSQNCTVVQLTWICINTTYSKSENF